MSRRYRDPDGVVHEASDLGLGNNITLCERQANTDTYDTRDLKLTQEGTTCLFCLAVPEWFKRMTNA